MTAASQLQWQGDELVFLSRCSWWPSVAHSPFNYGEYHDYIL